ncbi:LPXTG cell wall anchor domain-containing protein [Limosilactobacillus oris]|uniref:LPXTG cell wall anchor domain-containing protein n=1 Tax=Limosilactobacillus oris TaxID=1632 RepID=UPI0024B37597|nr:LPXTG cell wall anchor domain-containing protein [Limosilactobacillus oris]WHO85746.1 LPXTG cell wall anchor domain-containing protein [Limosilactobacillus oris]
MIDDLIADAQANRHTVYTVYYTRDQQPTPTPAPGETPTTTPSETPVTPETTGNKTATPVGGPLTVQTGRSALVSATTKAGGLPQTGAQAGRESMLGLGVAMLTTLLGLLGIKKREH